MVSVGGFRFIVVSLFVSITSIGIALSQPTEIRRLALLEQLRKNDSTYRKQQDKVLEYSKDMNIPVVSYDGMGNPVVLVSFDETGHPEFMSLHNSGAATTTGVSQLRTGGGLGLSLEGEGMIIGVWDGGNINPHVEFGDRLLQTEGTSASDHATHVTGTIISSGFVNAASKGMAPKAQARTWDFSNDLSEMLVQARSDQSTLLLSNHSYGLIMGWRFDAGSWQWFGNASISSDEDYRFGFYSSNARSWDQLAFNAPYYTIVKSAGNDRSDTGNGTRPPDCNGGEGYDCLGDISNAKNIIVVGAVNKVVNYNGPENVQMSSFSSWGPTDDGRIKPDLVGAGVSLFSTVSSTENGYGLLSGTSMAAPNVTGSLALLQELNKNLTGNYLRASTLKAIAIHTAKEAGSAPGPDYRFGWGLLDVAAGAKLLLNNDNKNILVKEEVLSQGETYEFLINPESGKKITATLVWTDPPGTPVPASLDPTDIMLVNDLDLRIVDEGGNEIFPWILNPQSPATAATRGDNFRDNVEKIEFDNPAPRPYKVRVSHKGSLQNVVQAFSLVVEYTSADNFGTAYYWVGGSGDWHNSTHWSLTSGGATAGQIPSESDRVFFDENSFTSAPAEVTVSEDASVSSLVWLSQENVEVKLNGGDLRVSGNLNVTTATLRVSGTNAINFTSEEQDQLQLIFQGNDFSKAELKFNGKGVWKIIGSVSLGKIHFIEGTLNINDQNIEVSEFSSSTLSSKTLNINGTKVSGIKNWTVMPDSDNLTLITSNSSLIITDQNALEVDFSLPSQVISGEVHLISSSVNFYGNPHLSSLNIKGEVSLYGNKRIDELNVFAGSILKFENGSTQFLTKNSSMVGSAEFPILLQAISGSATLNFDGHFKVCFDFLQIKDVNVYGSGIVNAGLNSELQNSQSWLMQNCEDVLFPDFEFKFTCAGSLIEFTDLSEGDVQSWSWNFDNAGSSNEQNPYFTFNAQGDYLVTLSVSNQSSVVSFDKIVSIIENSLPENQVVFSNNRFFSIAAAPSYQWFRNGEPIVGANERSYAYTGESGVYFVVTKNAECSRVSAPYVITAVELTELSLINLSVFPIPADNELYIEIPAQLQVKEVRLIDSFGRMVNSIRPNSEVVILDTSQYAQGLYILQFLNGAIGIQKKVVIKH